MNKPFTRPIVCFGDSLIALGAWPKALSDRFSRPFINAGIGGNTTAQGLDRFEQDVAVHKPLFVLISFGTNDQVVYDPAVGPQVSLPQFEENLRRLCRRCSDIHAKPIFLIMGAIEENAYYSRHPKEWCEPYGGVQRSVARYRDKIRAVAAESGAGLIDLDEPCRQNAEAVLGTPQTNPQFDGVHPSEIGWALLEQWIGDGLSAYLKP